MTPRPRLGTGRVARSAIGRPWRRMPLAARPPVPCRVPASRAAEACPSRLFQTLLTCGDESAIPESLARASQRHVVVLPLRAITLGVLSEGVRTMPELISNNHRVAAPSLRRCSPSLVSSVQVSPPRHRRVTTKKLYFPNEAICRPDCPKQSEIVHRPAHADPHGNGGQCGHAYAHEEAGILRGRRPGGHRVIVRNRHKTNWPSGAPESRVGQGQRPAFTIIRRHLRMYPKAD